MPTCKSCGNIESAFEIDENGICSDCSGYSGEPQIKNMLNKDRLERVAVKSKAASYLHLFSWLNLIFAIIASVFIFATMSVVEVPTYAGYTKEVTNLYGIVIGFAILFEGIFVSALGLTISYIADNIKK